jgi:hypothetical protein
MVTSRFVSLRLAPAGAGGEPRLVKTMVPMFDMFNHSPLANVVHAFDPRAQAVRRGQTGGEKPFFTVARACCGTFARIFAQSACNLAARIAAQIPLVSWFAAAARSFPGLHFVADLQLA